MGDLILAISCSLAIGAIFKVCGRSGVDRQTLIVINYVCAALIAVALTRFDRLALAVRPAAMFVGVGVGFLFTLTFTLYSAATDKAGLALSTAVARISVVIPFAASWLIWSEQPGTYQLVGLLFAIVALALLSSVDRQANAARPAPAGRSTALTTMSLIALFLSAGITDTSLKLYEEEFSASVLRPFFMLLVFVSAATIGLVAVTIRIARKSGPVVDLRTASYGIALGIVNYGSVEFFLRALSALPGTIAFPVNHVGIVIGGTILGTSVWSEILSSRNRIGLALAAVALVLLTAQLQG